MKCEKCKKRIEGKYQLISDGEMINGDNKNQTQKHLRNRVYCYEHRVLK